MVGHQRITSLEELSDKITDTVADRMAVCINQQIVAQAVLDAISKTGKADIKNVPTVIIEEAIGQAIEHAVCEDIVLEVVSECLRDAGFTDDPPKTGATKKIGEKKIAAAAPDKPAVSMDVTALREQILGLPTPSSQIPCST
jgi:hypothetical protein